MKKLFLTLLVFGAIINTINSQEQDKSTLEKKVPELVVTTNIFPDNGSVGIGTTKPIGKLQVIGDSYLQGKVFIGSNDTYFYRDAANRIKTNDMFYVGSSSPNTYLYSSNTYLGATSGDKIHLRGNIFTWTSGGGGTINSSGKVGIGTTTPGANLHVESGTDPMIKLGLGSGYTGYIVARGKGTSGYYRNLSLVANSIDFKTATSFESASSVSRLFIAQNGNIGIGVTNPTAKLTVDGKILATEIEVVSSVKSDFVFEEDYKLRSLEEVEEYVKENKHLPEIPSMYEFAKEGQNLGVMQDLLLRKIEELTLYSIDQNKKNLELEKRVQELENIILNLSK